MAFKHTFPTRQKVKTIAILFSLVGLLLFPTLKLKAQNPPVPDWVLAKSKIHGRPFLKKTVGAEARRQKFDALYYGLHFKIDFLHRQIWAFAREHFASLQNNLTAITLDFNNKQLTIDSIAGAAVSYTRNGSFLDITLDRPYQKGDTFNVTIYYSGNPEKPDTISFKFDYTLDEEPYVWTLSEPYGARDWWPCKDTPADKADSADIFVTVPEGNVVASNGFMVSDTADSEAGWHTVHWHESYPIATYLISLVSGPLAHFQDYYHYSATDSMLLDYYVFPILLYNAQEYFKEVPDYLDALSHFYGPYPFLKEKYGMAQFGWHGGMEHQTITSIGGVYKSWRFLYVHELGHQWFGDKVTCATWRDIWLNEGFATYSEALYAQWAGLDEYPPGMDAYHAYMDRLLYTDDGTIIVADTTRFSEIFSRIVYYKGAWLLHMLRHVIGNDAFFTSLRTYLNDPHWTYGSVRTENFVQICEKITGQNLHGFFNQWLNYPYYPVYEYQWSAEQVKAGVQTKITIKQTQQQTVYVMPIDLKFVFADGRDTILTVQNDKISQEYQFLLHQMPVQLILDPDHWILSENRELTPPAYAQVAEIYRVYPNPSPGKVRIELRHLLNENVLVDIYDIQGHLIRTLQSKGQQFFLHTYLWDGKNDNGQPVASGVYIIRTRAPGIPQKQRKVVILK